MKKFSLKLRLMIFFILIAAATWGVAAVVSLQECREEIDEFFDSYQLMLGRQLASADWSKTTAQTQKKTDNLIDEVEESDADDDAIAFAVFHKNGQMIFNDNEEGKNFSSPSFDKIGRFSKEKIDDEEWRVLWLSSIDKNYVIAVGQELDYRYDVALETVETLLFPWFCGLIILLIATIIMVAKEFRPLKKISSDLQNRNSDDLSPLDYSTAPAEVRPLLEALNRLLEKVAAMLQKERSFISDSAHELRSPLTALKIQLEVLRLSQEDPKAQDAAISKLEQGVERSIRLIEQLLALSKTEQTSAMSEDYLGNIDWKNILSTLKEEYLDKLSNKNLVVESEITGSPIQNGNPVLAAMMLRNLFDNAIKYSPQDSKIKVQIDDKKLEVINSQTEVEEKTLQRLGERFFRPAGQKETGSGLGLAIVKKIAELHHCQLVLKNTEDGFSVQIIKQD